MKTGVKIALIVGGVAAAGIIGGFVIYPAIKKGSIRRRLDEAFKNPASLDAAGGMDKFLISEAFNTKTFQTSGKATLSRLEAREKAKTIWDNYSSWLSSNQTAIVGAFTGLGHLHDVSKISYEFYQSYDNDLLEVLKTALTDKSKYNILLGKLAQLPKD